MRLKFGKAWNGRNTFHLDGELMPPQQGMILLMLMGNRCCTRNMIADMLWPDENDTPDTFEKVIGTDIYWVRHKVEAGGWSVVHRHQGSSYHYWTLVRADEIQLAA